MSAGISPTSKISAAVQNKSNYRWIVLAILFVTYTINFADRTNLGIVLPTLKQEFELTNLQLGQLASFFFLSYALVQIPAGFIYSRYGTRVLVPVSVFLFSLVTVLMGTATSAAQLTWLRLALGISEGPGPVGMATTVKTWFPKKEQSFATSFFSASVMFAPIVVPIVGVWILVNYGWRSVFYWFGFPGIVMAILWYLLIHNSPKESPYCNDQEKAYIMEDTETAATVEATATSPAAQVQGDFGWFDKFIRLKKVETLDTKMKVLKSKNIWINTIAYFMMCQVLYGLLTWVPSYLVNAKGFPLMTMGFVAAAPWIGGCIGVIGGGWVSDNILLGRRKPNMLLTALSVAIIMIVMIYLPTTVTMVTIGLFLSGFLLNIGWQNFMAYSMGLTTVSTYPVAIAIVNSGGNLGGFVSPMLAGLLLDTFKTYDAVFIYFAVASIIGFVLLSLLDEPA
ncbi:putative galactarate transporter [Sporomusa carbonis]|uniref:MFS transporter n=1 Tax=Sporomusa carbonis TaxID=3076075 RepID=UPI003A7221F7